MSVHELKKVKVIKREDRKPSPEDYERQHKIALFRYWAEHDLRHVFNEMAEKFGYRRDKAA
jgi:hypothetical protein